MSNDIADRVKKIVVEHLGVEESKVTENASFSYQIVATNSPTSYGASNLPAGLSIDTRCRMS